MSDYVHCSVFPQQITTVPFKSRTDERWGKLSLNME